MKKINKYFWMLFVGSILPFLIVESYFHEYVMIGYLILLTTIALASCFVIDSLKGKVVRWLDARHQGLEDVPLMDEQPEIATLYYFRNYW